VSAIACTPGGACTDLDLTGATVTATVSTGATTEVRFTNTSTVGKLKVCKVAGAGIAAGTPFTFTVTVGTQAPQTLTINAGDCATVTGIPDGTSVHVAETPASSFRVFSIACNPGCTSIDLGGSAVDLTAARNTEKTVTFTNEATP
jgi:hypothetical protein